MELLVAERQEFLVARLKTAGKIVAKDVARELGLSEDSVRRDLRELAAAGLCQRVYGGALPVSPAMADYSTRTQVETDSKTRVARRAVELLYPGCRALLDGGTTTLAVVQALPDDLGCTVITHSPTIAVALLPKTSIEVFVLGGRLFRHSAVTCGAAAVEAAQSVSADIFLMGVTGVHPRHGLTTGDPEEAAMKRALAARAADTYVLASTEKLGAVSPYSVLPLDDIAGVITDENKDAPVLSELVAGGTEILYAAGVA